MVFANPSVFATWDEAYLLGGAQTPFTDLNGGVSREA